MIKTWAIDIYTIRYICDNCSRETTLAFKKGEKAPNKIKDKCFNCGCNSLHKGLFQ